MENSILHIGMPRSGSTLLQRQVFPRWNNINYIGPPYTFYNHHFQRLLFADDTLYDEDQLRRELSRWEDTSVLISDENFVGLPLYWQFGNRSRTLKRLARLFPDSTAVLFLRAQPELLRSQYSLAVMGGVYESPERYIFHRGRDFTWEEQASGKIPNSRDDHALLNPLTPLEWLEGYLYSPLIELCESVFEKVEIFLFEDLVNDQDKTLDRLAKLTGRESHDLELPLPALNKGANSAQVRKLRKWNRLRALFMATRSGRAFWYRRHRKLARSNPDAPPFELSESLEGKLREFFAEDNSKLAKSHPRIELERYAERYALRDY